jgi:hypothetical protein
MASNITPEQEEFDEGNSSNVNQGEETESNSMSTPIVKTKKRQMPRRSKIWTYFELPGRIIPNI